MSSMIPAKRSTLLQVDDELSNAVIIQPINAGNAPISRRSHGIARLPVVQCQPGYLSKVYYIGLFAILGSALRGFLGRVFGSDCTDVEFDNHPVGDFLEPLTSKICITSDGTMKLGGSLFTDLPANMLGSLLMGMLSPKKSSMVFPWFRANHPLQKEIALHMGLKVGLCGCLTSWSSWNTQMIVMMDGMTTEFPPQIEQALTGYVLGITCCIASFIFGEYLRKCFQPPLHGDTPTLFESQGEGTHGQTLENNDLEHTVAESSVDKGCLSFSRMALLMVVILLLTGFGIGDGLSGIAFYRTMWMATIFSPFGAFMRWGLSTFNPASSSPHWFPWGTLFANTIAAALGAAAEALKSASSSNSERVLWVSPVLHAVQLGFAGSLSTVSTMVRELAFMRTPGRAIAYFSATTMISVALGLAIYRPTILACQS